MGAVSHSRLASKCQTPAIRLGPFVKINIEEGQLTAATSLAPEFGISHVRLEVIPTERTVLLAQALATTCHTYPTSASSPSATQREPTVPAVPAVPVHIGGAMFLATTLLVAFFRPYRVRVAS